MFLIYLKIYKQSGQVKDIRRTKALPGIIIYQQNKSIISAFKVIFAHWGHPHSTYIRINSSPISIQIYSNITLLLIIINGNKIRSLWNQTP